MVHILLLLYQKMLKSVLHLCLKMYFTSLSCPQTCYTFIGLLITLIVKQFYILTVWFRTGLGEDGWACLGNSGLYHLNATYEPSTFTYNLPHIIYQSSCLLGRPPIKIGFGFIVIVLVILLLKTLLATILALFLGLDIQIFQCDVCQFAKHKQVSFSLCNERHSKPLHLIHSDIWGPS